MENLFGVVIILVLVASMVVPFLLVLFSRRYPKEQEGTSKREPPAM